MRRAPSRRSSPVRLAARQGRRARPCERAVRALAHPAESAIVLSFVLSFALAACGLIGPSVGPEGQTDYDSVLRQLARDGRFDDALKRTGPEYRDEVGDELLRLLHEGLLQHYAGRYEESNATLQRAERIVEDRYTRSLSLAILSLVTSDRVLAYMPNRTERLMVNYYGALNYLALGDAEEAAVEARRLSRVLDLTAERAVGPTETGLRRALRYFAASVFEAAGEENDAAVAYRNVWRSAAGGPGQAEPGLHFPPGAGEEQREAAESLWPGILRPTVESDSGGVPSAEVVVFVESGFVAHRVERSAEIPLFPEEAEALTSDDADRRYGAASCVVQRGFGNRSGLATLSGEGSGGWPGQASGHCTDEGVDRAAQDGEGTGRELYWLRVAWPEMWQEAGSKAVGVETIATNLAAASSRAGRAAPIRVPQPPEDPGPTGRGLAVPAGLNADLSGSVIGEFEEDRGQILVKAVARAAAKYSIVRAVDEELSKKDEVLGDIARLTANAAVALLERADTRSWHLLPAGLSVTRLRLPAGEHEISLRLAEGPGDLRDVRLGEVTLREGEVQVVSARTWP